MRILHESNVCVCVRFCLFLINGIVLGKPVVYESAVNHLAGLPSCMQSILSSVLRGYKECARGWATRMLCGHQSVHADAHKFSRRGFS